MIKNWVKFLESTEDGYSKEFDEDYDELGTLIDQIINKYSYDNSNKYEREVLELMNKQELLDILSE